MIIFTFGVNDRGVADIRPDPNGQPHIHVDGSLSALGNIDLGNNKPLPLLLFGGRAEQPPLNIPQRPDLIFNQISNPDTHSIALERCVDVCRRFDGIPVINHPDAIKETARDAVYQKLHDIDGVRFPKTVRCVPESPEHVLELIESEGFKLPVIVRTAGEHNASNMVLVESSDHLEKLHTLAFDGSDFYIIEFIDCSDENGIFKKQRILIMDGKAYPRHVFFGPDWLINSKAIDFMLENPQVGDLLGLMDELDERMPRLEPALNEISKRMKLDVFGIDCDILDDDTLVIYEANANMYTLRDTIPPLSPRVKIIQQQLRQLIERRSLSALPPDSMNITRTFHS